MLKAFSTPGDRRRTLALLATCAALALAAAFLGVDDNPPGLWLAFLSAAMLATAFAHSWRSPASFRRLMYASGLGFLVSVVLHNVFAAAASVPDLPGFAQGVLMGAGVVFFFTAILLCPAAFVVGAVGAVVMARRRVES